jgi:hypothetical protein
MSLTYVSKRDPDACDWLPNNAGSQLLGLVHEATGARLADFLTGPTPEISARLKEEYEKALALRVEGKHHEAAIHYRPAHAYQATAEQAHQDAATIRANLDNLPPVFENWNCLFDGTYQDFLGYVEEWCQWLDQCEGYEIL